MRFFSRLVFILNVCFILSVILRLMEMHAEPKPGSAGILGFQPLESTIAILGYLAIFINVVFFLIFLVQFPARRMNGLSRLVVFFNLIMFPAQIYYFFFSHF